MGQRKMAGGMAVKWHRNFVQLKLDTVARGMSLNDLSEMSGMARGTISKWVNKPQRPRTKNWEAVQKVLATMPVLHAAKPAPVPEPVASNQLELISDPAVIAQSFKDNGNADPVTPAATQRKKKYPKHTKGYTKTAAWYAYHDARVKGKAKGKQPLVVPRSVKHVEWHDTPVAKEMAKPVKQVLIGLIADKLAELSTVQVALVLADVMQMKVQL